MELSYKNNKLKKSLTTDKGIAKGYGTIAKKEGEVAYHSA